MEDRTITAKELKILERWGRGALARRKVKKMVQTMRIANLKKPIYREGKLVFTDKKLLSNDDLAFQLSSNGGARNLYWNTQLIDIGKGRKYEGQWKADKFKSTWTGLGTIVYPDGSKY